MRKTSLVNNFTRIYHFFVKSLKYSEQSHTEKGCKTPNKHKNKQKI